MANPTVCTVTGVTRDSSGAILGGVTVTASALRPFIHPTDSSLIVNYFVSTSSSVIDGTWSLALVETATPAVTMTISLSSPVSSGGIQFKQDYTVTVPNSASATFASLITGQI